MEILNENTPERNQFFLICFIALLGFFLFPLFLSITSAGEPCPIINGSTIGQIAVWNGTYYYPSINALLIEAADGYSLGIGDRVFGGLTGSNSTGLRNTAFGTLALGSLTTGGSNTAIGYVAGIKITTGSSNALFSDNAGHELTTGSQNMAIGDGAMYFLTTGNRNNAIGHGAVYNVRDGEDNTGIGDFALFSVNGGDRNIAIGSHAGYRQTGSDALVIDNRQRANSAQETTNAILYGIMADTPADQNLRINANVNITQGLEVVGHLGITGNYTNGNCWQSYSGGILYATNCTEI